MRKTFALCFLLLAFRDSNAGSGFVYLSDTSKLFFASNYEVYSADKKQLLYFSKGNIFFTGSNDDRQNIFLLCTSMDITSEKLQTVQEKDNTNPFFSFSYGKIYMGKPDEDDSKSGSELLHVERTGKWLAFYSSLNDSLLAYYAADSFPNSLAVITAYTLLKKFNLAEKLGRKKTTSQTLQQKFSTLKPVWQNVTDNEWIWDGQVLRLRWNPDTKYVWTFDGKTIKPYYGNNIYEQYEWDGEYFKPIWRTNRAQEWQWDGRIFKPVWDTDWANQYVIENNVVKPWNNVQTEREWVLEGDIPVPILILVLSGTAKSH